MILGIAIIIFGIFLLLKNTGVIDLSVGFWSLFYPLVFIGIGFCLVVGIHNVKKYWKILVDIVLRGKDGKGKL